MLNFLENILIAVSSIFLVYVGRDHFVTTACLIIATRTICFLSDYQQKKPTSAATEVSKNKFI